MMVVVLPLGLLASSRMLKFACLSSHLILSTFSRFSDGAAPELSGSLGT